MFEKYEDVLTVDQMCEALQIGLNTGYKLLKTGEIRSIRIGDRVHRIPKKWLIEYINQAA